MGVDTELLLTFLSVVETGSISAAARVLHRSQPAITERLQKLAQTVGEPLYIRGTGGIHLTAAGETLLPMARRLRHLTQECDDIIARRQRLREGLLRIVATNTAASYFLSRYLVAFREQYPDIDVHMRGGVIDWREISVPDWDLFFLEGGLDLEELPSYYAVTPWLQDEILTAFPEGHPLLAQEHIGWRDLLAYPIVWRERYSGIRRTIERAFAAEGLVPRQSIEVTGVEAVGTAVSAGLGIGFITAAALHRHTDWKVVGRRIPVPDGIRWTLYMASPQPLYQSHTTRAFVAFMGDATERLGGTPRFSDTKGGRR
ncbi:MAG: LysR family transcriptional regulator [Gammaproteobacteria bacterium]|nr:LysR family transcriptional regulator [Gammaproteobacteria bacterium]